MPETNEKTLSADEQQFLEQNPELYKQIKRLLEGDTLFKNNQNQQEFMPKTFSIVTARTQLRAIADAFKPTICTTGGEYAADSAHDRSMTSQAIFNEVGSAHIGQVLNAADDNNIDANLKRILILQETVRNFAVRVLPMRLFSTVFLNVGLQGDNEISIAYYPLQAAASQNFQDGYGVPGDGTGYQFGQQTNTQSKLITVQSRKYQPLDYSSNDFRRQPWFNAVELGKINAERLALDILLDIFSVFTPANYPYIGQADPMFNPNLMMPAGAYDSNQVVDLKTVATNLNWPDSGRALIAGTTIDNALSKDPEYKEAFKIGTADVIQEGKFPRLSGFDYACFPNLPNNGVNVAGLIAFRSALAAAFAPIDPAPGVRKQLFSYDIAVDAMTGIAMNHRHWGLAQADRDFEVIESGYGYEQLLPNAAQILIHP